MESFIQANVTVHKPIKNNTKSLISWVRLMDSRRTESTLALENIEEVAVETSNLPRGVMDKLPRRRTELLNQLHNWQGTPTKRKRSSPAASNGKKKSRQKLATTSAHTSDSVEIKRSQCPGNENNV